MVAKRLKLKQIISVINVFEEVFTVHYSYKVTVPGFLSIPLPDLFLSCRFPYPSVYLETSLVHLL